MEGKKQQPEKKFRAGAVSASIWRNESEKGSYQTVQLSRNYKDRDGSWKSASSLRVADIPKATLVLQKAYEHLALEREEEDVEIEAVM